MSKDIGSKTIGFIGLGNMGLPMATNLLAAGYSLRVYNRTLEKGRSLAEQGAILVNTPAEVVAPETIVITMLANDQVLEEAVLGENGILEKLSPSSIHLSMSTISPATAQHLAAQHEQQGVHYLAAPVFGRPDAAAAKKLWICISGNPAAKAEVAPVLDALGQGVFDFGETPEAANIVKVTGNFLIVSAIEAMAEAFTLAEKNGIDRTQIAELFGKTLFACPIYQNYGRMIAQQQYEPAGFKLSLGLKDVTLALQTARTSQMPMPLASLLHDRLMAAVAKGKGDLDWTGLASEMSEQAGIPPIPNP
ncbi:NAD(P)-dependent oxidoreductase [Oculatella sp. FACHB-28]|uniref:NAD(P)-dependent oxidoreductase n=1 Tax=Oculatella sp. FACHB-28 TaxID=2692845 RepID=UPI00168609E1|nr:NAD(P)-dependent oxidoreductase [Oculatella sp. FACHB-28]MBD2056386.1 NAD(P)-dependent oxidoreductase [Oculatella sp. FACHB-28]